ncbi:MAG TPA: type IV toxin-antitoxin system AbiEi family antitoxin domain-containing protein [Microbacterium sp.]|nr:type IV toxin-antitoxin system AbiEi family antitoxin domain-containing protein [Microbacterium sp.]
MCAEPQSKIKTIHALRASGMSRAAVDRAVQAGTLSRIRRGLYRCAEVCEPVQTAAEHGGVLGCVSAARHVGLWLLGEDDKCVHVSMGAHSRSHHEGCRCVAHRDDDDTATTPDAGLATVRRLLRQVLFCRGVTDFFVALESARRKDLIDEEGLAWLRENTNARGRDAVDFSRSDADSGLESLFRWRLRDLASIVLCQVDVASVGRVDFLIGDRLIVEIDGRENHAGQDKRHKDLVRDANAAAWGYITLRFDYALIVHDWDSVEAAVRGLVEAGMHLR